MSATAGPVEERPVLLEVNGATLDRWTASPGHAEALGAGRLLTEGFIRGRADLLELAVEDSPTLTIIRARVDPARVGQTRVDPAGAAAARAPPAPFAAQAQAVLHPAADAAEAAHPVPPAVDAAEAAALVGLPGERPRAPLPPLDAFAALFRELFQSADLYRETGGLHSAALSDGVTLRYRLEEVGRHNAVDKVVGLALLAGDELARLGLLVSARVSGAMALKAARAGLAWVASRSVPTTMAVAVAEAAGLPIVARAAGRQAHVYASPEP